MVNHVRTLLLNRSRNGQPPAAIGEEYVPADFVQKQLSGAVQTAWQMLFGMNPDRFFLNYRLRQFMSLIHATELEAVVREKDPRITYLPFADDIFNVVSPTVTVTQITGTGSLVVAGTPTSDEGAGRTSFTWAVSAAAGNAFPSTRLTPPQVTSTPVITPDSRGRVVFPLPASLSLIAKLSAFAVGDAWSVTTFALPQTDIGALLEMTAGIVGEVGLSEIFAGTDPTSVSLQNVWRQHPISAYKYVALLLALANQIDNSPTVPG